MSGKLGHKVRCSRLTLSSESSSSYWVGGSLCACLSCLRAPSFIKSETHLFLTLYHLWSWDAAYDEWLFGLIDRCFSFSVVCKLAACPTTDGGLCLVKCGIHGQPFLLFSGGPCSEPRIWVLGELSGISVTFRNSQ